MKPSVIVCTLPSDSHTWNLIVVSQRLEELGLDVTNLGSCVPVDELVKEVQRWRPDLLLVSSINGLGEVEALTLIDGLVRAGVLGTTRAVLGGKLAISPERECELASRLGWAGYAGVYTGSGSWDAFVRDLPRLLPSEEPAALLEEAMAAC